MNTSKRIMLIVGGLLIAGFILMMCLESATKKQIPGFEPLDAQLELTENAWNSWFSPKIDVSGQKSGVNVLCDWYQYKAQTALNAENAQDSAERFNADTMDLVMATSISANFWAENAAFEQLYALYNGDAGSRDKILEQCREAYPELGTGLDLDVSAFRDLAANEGFLDAQGHILPDKKRVIHLLHRHLWVSVSSQQFPQNRIETPEEHMAFFRWQIEQSSMSAEQKLRKIQNFRTLENSDYDYGFAAAKIYSDNGMFGEACVILNESLKDTPADKAFRIERYRNMIQEISQAHPGACGNTAAH